MYLSSRDSVTNCSSPLVSDDLAHDTVAPNHELDAELALCADALATCHWYLILEQVTWSRVMLQNIVKAMTCFLNLKVVNNDFIIKHFLQYSKTEMVQSSSSFM
jgi:hypothetical protein